MLRVHAYDSSDQRPNKRASRTASRIVRIRTVCVRQRPTRTVPASSITLSVACVAAFVGLVAAERFGWRRARVAFKLLASSAFVAVAWLQPGSGTDYGRLIVAALALSWVGDMCLLSSRSSLFLAGLAAFLAAHVSFGAAFALGAIDRHALVAALVVLVPVGILTMRWLWLRLLDAV